uniref:Uncharacterized protein n=1 Tax=Oryza glumipatula TaxID=40148 RepID=A0A0E0AFK8_9ORYZ
MPTWLSSAQSSVMSSPPRAMAAAWASRLSDGARMVVAMCHARRTSFVLLPSAPQEQAQSSWFWLSLPRDAVPLRQTRDEAPEKMTQYWRRMHLQD